MILGDENNNDLVVPTTDTKLFSRNMVIAMEHISKYIRPYLTKTDKDMIDYAKFHIEDDPVQEAYNFLEEFVIRRKVISLELIILVTECIIRSSAKVKRGVFRLDPSIPGPSPGKIIFVKWLSYAINAMEGKRTLPQSVLQNNEDSVEEMAIASLMELICAMTEVIQKPKQIEVLKTKFGVDWIFIVDTVLSFAAANNISMVQTKAANAKKYLEKINAGEELEKYVPKVVPPYKDTPGKMAVSNPSPPAAMDTKISYLEIEKMSAPISTTLQRNERPHNDRPKLLSDGTWNSTKSGKWNNFIGPKRKASLHPKGPSKTISQPHVPYSARESNTSTYKRGYPDESSGEQRKRNRPSDVVPYGGSSAVPRENISNFSGSNQPTGRGRGMTLPAWMTKDTTPVATNNSNALGSAVSSVSQPVEMGRGRGRGKTLPAWMTKSQNTDPSGPRSERNQSGPHHSSENHHGGQGDRNFPSSSGRGRGRERTLPAWQTAAASNMRDEPNDGNQLGNPGRGRGRGMTLPSWMTKDK
jgi:hypothetical protein